MQPQTSLFPLEPESSDLLLVHEPQGGELQNYLTGGYGAEQLVRPSR